MEYYNSMMYHDRGNGEISIYQKYITRLKAKQTRSAMNYRHLHVKALSCVSVKL